VSTFAELRQMGENLARFASIRERAESPADRILIQNKDGVQKLVAGDSEKTLVATVGPTSQPNGVAVVGSRLFLSTIKTMKGKGEAEINIVDGGAVVRTSFGSEIAMKELTDHFMFLSPAKYVPGGWTARFDEGFLPAAARYLSFTGDYVPLSQVLAQAEDDQMYFRATDEHIMSVVGPLTVPEPRTLHFPASLFPAMRGLDAGGGMYVPDIDGPQVEQVQFGAGKYRVISVLFKTYGKFPKVAQDSYTVKVSADKRLLIETLKSLAGRHQYSRVVMDAQDGVFTIKAGDSGAAKLDVECNGTGSLPVNATFIAKVLQAVDGKTATLEFSTSPSLVRIIGDEREWPMLVSPMK